MRTKYISTKTFYTNMSPPDLSGRRLHHLSNQQKPRQTATIIQRATLNNAHQIVRHWYSNVGTNALSACLHQRDTEVYKWMSFKIKFNLFRFLLLRPECIRSLLETAEICNRTQSLADSTCPKGRMWFSRILSFLIWRNTSRSRVNLFQSDGSSEMPTRKSVSKCK